VGWYLTKGWFDQEDGIDTVRIHYTWSPRGRGPDWDGFHGCRELRDVGGSPRGRQKVLHMPVGVHDEHGAWHHDYLLHYAFEVHRAGDRWSTELFTEEIVSRELDFFDPDGELTNLCIYWSVDSWEAPVYSPMEEERFPHDSEFASPRYYAYEDRPRFHAAKAAMLAEIPAPHRWHGRMWGPRGARIVQQFHLGRTHPDDRRWEGYMGPDGPTEPGAGCWVHEL
jgi:hypothetical protein